MDDKIAYDLYRHFYLAYLWFLRYMEKHDIYFHEDDKTDILENHLNEVEKIFGIIEQSMPTEIVQENRKQMAAQLGLTEGEAKAWIDNEPDFAKRIVTQLRKETTKRRSDVTLRKVTSSSRLLPLFCVAVKNRLLNRTLFPYV